MNKSVLILLLFVFFTELSANPHNFTHKVKMTLSVDGEIKGDVSIGLWRESSTEKPVDNFLALCLGYATPPMITDYEFNIKVFFFYQYSLHQKKGHKIYQIFRGEFMVAGDINAPNYDWRGNQTIYNFQAGQKDGFWKHQETPYHVEPGKLNKKFTISFIGVLTLDGTTSEHGLVGSEFKLFLYRPSELDNWKYMTFGKVYEGMDLLAYIDRTAGENNGVPTREVIIEECDVALD